jgi:hypothetical protein
MLHCPAEKVESVLLNALEKKNQDIKDKNLSAFRSGRRFLRENGFRQERFEAVQPRTAEFSLFLHGNEAPAG